MLRRLLFGSAIGLPLASLALQALAWLRFGMPLPMYDDWSGYASGLKGSFAAENLLKPLNDTLAPVGYVLDALAERWLDGHAVAYQFLSMLVVLGGLLWLQWRLLVVCLEHRWQQAACFVLTLLMLQPGSYWGQQSLAYHQALPLLFILSALLLLLSPGPAGAWRMAGLGLLGLLAGFSYVSGAFAVLALGLALLGCAALCPLAALRGDLWRGAAMLTLAGGVASALQFGLAVYPNPGLTHRVDAPLALPVHADFWWFFMGKLGRSLALSPSTPVLSLMLVLGVLALAAVLGVALLRPAASQRPHMPASVWRTTVVFVGLAAVVCVYMALVAAGRTRLRPPEVATATQVFAFAFERFHFFWATLWWPWLLAAVCVVWRSHGPRLQALVVAGALVSTALMLAGGVMSHARAYADIARWRQDNLGCLLTQLQRGVPVDCPEYVLSDVAAAYVHGRATGAAFTRQFPVLPMPLGSDDPPPWFRWSRDASQARLHELVVEPGSPRLLRSTGSDPQLHVAHADASALRGCRLLQVGVLLRAAQADELQVFFRPLGEADYTETHSRRMRWRDAPGALQRLDLQIDSTTGFEPAVRLDVGNRPQAFELVELELRCQLAVAGQVIR